jgi:hypothetical protein
MEGLILQDGLAYSDEIIMKNKLITKEDCKECHDETEGRFSQQFKMLNDKIDKLPRQIKEEISKDIKLAILEYNRVRDENLENKLKERDTKIEKKMDEHEVKIDAKLSGLVSKEDFNLWRWILIVGMFLSIVMAAVKFLIS